MTPINHGFIFLLLTIVIAGVAFLRDSRTEGEPMLVYLTVAFCCGVLFVLTFQRWTPLAEFSPEARHEAQLIELHRSAEPAVVHDRICPRAM